MNQATPPTTDTLDLGNETATAGSGPSSTALGTGTPNAGFALTANVASVGFWAGMFGMTAWLML